MFSPRLACASDLVIEAHRKSSAFDTESGEPPASDLAPALCEHTASPSVLALATIVVAAGNGAGGAAAAVAAAAAAAEANRSPSPTWVR